MRKNSRYEQKYADKNPVCSSVLITWFTKPEETQSSCEQKVRSLNASLFKKATWQVEKCPKSGRLHIQGTFLLRTPMRLFTAKKAFVDTSIHVEKTEKYGAAVKYCMKEESRVDGPYTHSYIIPGVPEETTREVGGRADLFNSTGSFKDPSRWIWDPVIGSLPLCHSMVQQTKKKVD